MAMGSISTSIRLIDRVSAPVNNMISALDDVCSVFESVDRSMDSAFNTAPINSARQSIAAAQQQIIQLGNEQDNYTEKVEKSTRSANGLLGKVGQLVAAYATMKTVTTAMNLSDQMTQTTARLDMMNDGLQTTEELQQMIYQSAQASRGSYQESADAVAKMGIMAKDAFDSNAELVSFVEQLNKQFTIAGTSQEGVSAAMLQLTQAMSSGVLRGEELNSVFEQAPTIIQSIADYLGVPIGQIRAMAAEGQITGEIVKNALLSAVDETNAKFEQMPMTWGQVWNSMKNTALMEFQPVLNKINELANNQKFQAFAAGAVSALAIVAVVLLDIMNITGSIAGFFADNWSIIAPIVYGIAGALGVYAMYLGIIKGMAIASAIAEGIHVMWMNLKIAVTAALTHTTMAATAAQMGYNGALYACPLVWIIGLIIIIIALIYAVAAAIAKLTGIANTGFGVITGGINVVIHFFKNLGLSVANIALGIGSAIAALCSNMMTAFSNAILGIQSWFYNLLSTALSVIASIAAELNKLPFVKFDYSGITAQADEYAGKAAQAAGNKESYKSISDSFREGYGTFDTFQDGWVSSAFNSGAAWGDGVSNKVSKFFGGSKGGVDPTGLAGGTGYDVSHIPGNIADTAGNTARAVDSLEITNEDLKYLNDIAERDVINRFTTAEIKVEMNNNNNVSSDMDLDGMIDYLATGVNEAMEKAAEGVHE